MSPMIDHTRLETRRAMNFLRLAEAGAALGVGGLVIAASLWPAPLLINEPLRTGWMALTIGLSLIATLGALRLLSSRRRRNNGRDLTAHALFLSGVAVLALVSLISLGSTVLETGGLMAIAVFAKWTGVAILLGGALLSFPGRGRE